MEWRLHDAARTGDVPALLDLLRQDPLILDKIIVLCLLDTPLHTAATLGHVDFVRELLSRRPELASELDSAGNTPLHLASAKGHVQIVKDLLSFTPSTGKVRNLDGRMPLHVAAIKGRKEVVIEMVRDVPELSRVLTDRSETVMHLCASKNRREALKAVVGEIISQGEESDVQQLVNWRDCDGNTALHIAVGKRDVEMVKFLLTIPVLDVNLQNNGSSTPLDSLMLSPRDLNDMEIQDSLVMAGGLTAKEIPAVFSGADYTYDNAINPREISTELPLLQKDGNSENKLPKPKHKHGTDWLGRKKSALMVVASLIATVAFQAAITPPGGVWQDDLTVDANGNPVKNPHRAGAAIMAYNQKKEYGLYMIFNTIAFLASLSIILLLVSGLPMNKRRWMWVQMVTMWIAITAQVVTYFLALRHMSPEDAGRRLRDVTEISVLAWLCLMIVVLMGNIARVNMWILRKYGLLKKKDEKQPPSITLDAIADHEQDKEEV